MNLINKIIVLETCTRISRTQCISNGIHGYAYIQCKTVAYVNNNGSSWTFVEESNFEIKSAKKLLILVTTH